MSVRSIRKGRSPGPTVRKRPLVGSLVLGWIWPVFVLAAPDWTWESAGTFRRAPLSSPTPAAAGLVEVDSSAAGVAFVNTLSDAALLRNSNLSNGGGVALGDVDGDGWCDVYLCRIEGPNVLYRNLGGWRFESISEGSPIECAGQMSKGAVFADLDGDRDLDLLVTSMTAGPRCFRNDGRGRFEECTSESGLSERAGNMTATLGDIDGDGDLDLYISFFTERSILRDGGRIRTRVINGVPVVTGRYAKRIQYVDGRLVEFGLPDELYLNDGSGRFEAVDWRGRFTNADGSPARPEWDFGLSAHFRDLNGDLAPDIYVCNDFQTPDRIWINRGRGQFKAIDPLAIRTMSYASMGADFADVDRDGDLDFFVVEMLSPDHRRRLQQMSPNMPIPREIGEIDDQPQVPRNTFFLNRGDDTFAEIAEFSGIAATDWSWMPVFIDLDLDGYEDLLVTNGHFRDVNNRDANTEFLAGGGSLQASRAEVLEYPLLATPNSAFRNRGDLKFESMHGSWGFDSTRVSHGIALGDLDHDGDQDVVVNCLNAPPLLYRNDSSAPRIAVKLRGRPGNTAGVGAQIRVTGGPVAVQSQEMISGGRFLSSDEPIRTFAAGSAERDLSIEVRWRSGEFSRIDSARAGHLYEVIEPEPGRESGEAHRLRTRTASETVPSGAALFSDVSGRLQHRHRESAADDFSAQPLLPRRLSQDGPGVAWIDLDDDGDDDLVVGAGGGGSLGIFENTGDGQFRRWTDLESESDPVVTDQTGITGASMGRGEVMVLVGSDRPARSASAGGGRVVVHRFTHGSRSAASEIVSTGSGAVGPMVLLDVGGDPGLSLFVGERFIPGQFPKPASGHILRRSGADDGNWKRDAAWSEPFQGIGLVRGAVSSDLNGDARPDLILALEWGAIHVFLNLPGGFVDRTRALGFGAFTGVWNGVATGDFDADGRPDIVASNWGTNTAYQRVDPSPIRVFYGDFTGNGSVDTIESCFDPTRNQWLPWRDLERVGSALPIFARAFPTHESYANMDLESFLASNFNEVRHLEIGHRESTVFLNRGSRFEACPLPAFAQFAPAFGLAVADFTGDGAEDIVIAQNFFATRVEVDRSDAGRGLLLAGRGDGSFEAVHRGRSGLLIHGEQRGCAAGDFDADGRMDIVVAQNGQETKLYRNQAAPVGLRVRLSGPPENPEGIGAAMRLGDGRRWGPVREVQAGSGYWSRNSGTQVLYSGGLKRSHLWIRWPHESRPRIIPLEPDQASIVVSRSGVGLE